MQGKKGSETCSCKGTLGELVIPLILDSRDPAVRADVDVYDRVHDLFGAQTLEDVLVGEAEGDGVSRGGHLVGLDCYRGEEGYEAVPLGCELVEAYGVCYRIAEGCCWGPEGEMAEGGTAFEELGVLVGGRGELMRAYV